MGMFTSINTSASGLSAQRLRMDVIANNIANVNTTRTTEGGPFKRQKVVFMPADTKVKYKLPFLPDKFKPIAGQGVRVLRVEDDSSPFRLVYDPSHPDAIKTGEKAGYVQMPNVNVVTEMVDMISASRAYEANVAMIDHSKSIFSKALEIGA
ncbi:MAG: flagellar basal body rod protein FlgC [bacterium]|nr:flagellar basal body rod protein FlgC [bacterium]